ncbi:hypothetical protein [Enterobacter quasiroggenkampii]|uniref:hypothetical protein n=1 Tax=Enterobacter quasiroggenkampii TaxID=2497436 RepID=UPI0021D28020|nr:hypothetical protein [Enterobacter quasiroggenkampii]MCU6276991.1 hypothetical protein [Enterobacter quasiroggenkampii]
MADYRVNNYTVARRTGSDGIERVYLDVNLTNSSGNQKIASYWMVDDTRASISGIETALLQGFSYAVNTPAKVSITEDAPRTYLWFVLPSAAGKQQFQFTGAKI